MEQSKISPGAKFGVRQEGASQKSHFLLCVAEKVRPGLFQHPE